MLLRRAATLVILLATAWQVASQSVNARYIPRYSRAENSLGRDPSTDRLSTYLPNSVLEPNPSPEHLNTPPCTGSTVCHSAIQAYGALQRVSDSAISSPTSTTRSCTTTISGWPTQEVSLGTGIPTWTLPNAAPSDISSVDAREIVVAPNDDSQDQGDTQNINAGAVAGAIIGALTLGGIVAVSVRLVCRARRHRGVRLKQTGTKPFRRRSRPHELWDEESGTGNRGLRTGGDNHVVRARDQVVDLLAYHSEYTVTFPDAVHMPTTGRNAPPMGYKGYPEL